MSENVKDQLKDCVPADRSSEAYCSEALETTANDAVQENERTLNAEGGDLNLQQEDVQQVVLASVQNIQNVAELHDRLIHVLDSAKKIEVDASAITTVDTATLQLLLVLKQTALKLQKEVNIDFPSEKFIEAAELLGLAEMLDVDQAAAGFF
ncbi:STAS domain-containing protein [Methylomonas sp. MgM2]